MYGVLHGGELVRLWGWVSCTILCSTCTLHTRHVPFLPSLTLPHCAPQGCCYGEPGCKPGHLPFPSPGSQPSAWYQPVSPGVGVAGSGGQQEELSLHLLAFPLQHSKEEPDIYGAIIPHVRDCTQRDVEPPAPGAAPNHPKSPHCSSCRVPEVPPVRPVPQAPPEHQDSSTSM